MEFNGQARANYPGVEVAENHRTAIGLAPGAKLTVLAAVEKIVFLVVERAAEGEMEKSPPVLAAALVPDGGGGGVVEVVVVFQRDVEARD